MTIIKKIFGNSFYKNLERFEYKYHGIKTSIWYKIFLAKSGVNNTIFSPILVSLGYMYLHNDILIRDGARIEGVDSYQGQTFSPEIILYNGSSIEQNVHITCANRIEIGENTSIAANVTITDINHLYVDIRLAPQLQPIEVFPVKIGNNCKIYNNSVILPGVQLGNHSIVAANSVVVSGNYPDFSVLAGSPAKVIKFYNTLTSRWEKV